MGIHQLQLRTVNRALVCLDRAFKLPHLRPLRIELLLGDHALFVEKLKALVVHLHVAELRLIFGKLPFCLLELDLIGTRIDFQEAFALAHELTFLKINFCDLPIHAAVHGHGIKCCDRPESVEVHREVTALRGGHDNWHDKSAGPGSLAALPLAASAGRRWALRFGARVRSSKIPNTHTDKNGQSKDPYPAMALRLRLAPHWPFDQRVWPGWISAQVAHSCAPVAWLCEQVCHWQDNRGRRQAAPGDRPSLSENPAHSYNRTPQSHKRLRTQVLAFLSFRCANPRAQIPCRTVH